MKDISATDALIAVGLVMLATGIGFYDWRISLVVIGGLLTALGFVGSIRGA